MNHKTQTLEERQAKLLQLATEQGVKPIESTEDLRGDFWDEADEREESFDQWLRRTRAEGDRRGTG